MRRHVAIKILLALLAIACIALAPIVPVQFVLGDDLPEVDADKSINPDDVREIVIQARGGKFVNLIEIANGTVNAPFTYVSLIRPEDVPYEGSVEDRSDVVVGYGNCAPGALIAHCAGHKVYLQRVAGGWKVVERLDWIA